MEEDSNNARYVFYLAQNYRDIGNLAQAMEWYEKRAGQGGWEEEVWHAMYQVARIRHQLDWVWPLVLEAYLTAYQFRPSRAEALYHVARHYREDRQFHLAYLFSRPALETPYPDDFLFIERPVYEYALLLEHALSCGELGLYDEAFRAYSQIVACESVPEHIREMAEKNREHCLTAKALRRTNSCGLVAGSLPLGSLQEAESSPRRDSSPSSPQPTP